MDSWVDTATLASVWDCNCCRSARSQTLVQLAQHHLFCRSNSGEADICWMVSWRNVFFFFLKTKQTEKPVNTFECVKSLSLWTLNKFDRFRASRATSSHIKSTNRIAIILNFNCNVFKASFCLQRRYRAALDLSFRHSVSTHTLILWQWLFIDYSGSPTWMEQPGSCNYIVSSITAT